MRDPALRVICCTAFLFLAASGADVHADASPTPVVGKYPILLSGDGFPTGHETPEGVACDLARAFFTSDVGRFRAICPQLYPPSPIGTEYGRVLAAMADEMEKDAASGLKAWDIPVKIVGVAPARHMTKSGPGSYGYAVLNLADVMFVDVETELTDGQSFTKRTLVFKTMKGRWYAHAFPSIDKMISAGLYKEYPPTTNPKKRDTASINGHEAGRRPSGN